MVKGKRHESPEAKAQADSDEREAERNERLGVGGNKPELTEDEQRVLIYQHKAAYLVAKKAVDDAKAELLRVSKLAKTECGKSAIADIKELIALEAPKGNEALQADIDRKLRLARWANAAVGTQFSLMEDRTPEVDRAHELGKTAGLKGESKIPPYDASVPQYNAWCDGWHEGQSVLMSNFRDKLKSIDDAPPTDLSQMDPSERQDLDDENPVMAEFVGPDVSNPPFNPADDMAIPADGSIPPFLKRDEASAETA